MEDLRSQQLEALEAAAPYCEKISRAIGNLIEELSGNRQQDTDEYMTSIINGLNWIVEVYNGTRDLVNQNDKVIDKDAVNDCVKALNEAKSASDDAKMAEAFKGLRVFVEDFREAALKLTSGMA